MAEERDLRQELIDAVEAKLREHGTALLLPDDEFECCAAEAVDAVMARMVRRCTMTFWDNQREDHYAFVSGD